MPLLMCPNCNASMTSVDRSGVQFDMCPTCRGVWLDRGELEKLMEASREEASGPNRDEGQQPAPWGGAPQPPPQQHYEDRGRYEDRRPYDDHRGYDPRYGRRRDYDDDDHYEHGRRRKRGFDLFDIFD